MNPAPVSGRGRVPSESNVTTGNPTQYYFGSVSRFSTARLRLRLLSDRVAKYPLLSVLLSVASFAFLGPIAALVLVATLLDHEFAHRYMMRRLGYSPGPVRLLPVIGAYVRAGRPMLRSAEIAMIYLAGPAAGLLSAWSAVYAASKLLGPALEQQVFVGAAVAIGLNLFNLLPFEPMDGGLISRALPYPVLIVVPIVLAAWRLHAGLLVTPGGAIVLGAAILIVGYRVNRWRRYAAGLRARLNLGDATALQEWQASFNVPLAFRLLVASAYILTLVVGVAMLVNVVSFGHWVIA